MLHPPHCAPLLPCRAVLRLGDDEARLAEREQAMLEAEGVSERLRLSLQRIRQMAAKLREE